MLFFWQKFVDGDCRVTWGVVVVHSPSACKAWSHTCHPFPESFKDFPIKSLIDSLSWWHKFLMDDPLTVKKTNEHRFDFGFAHSRFLGTVRFCSVPLPTLAFCLGVIKIHDSSPVIMRLKNSGSLSRRSRISRQSSLGLAFCSIVRFFGTILAHTFLMSKSWVKI